jgi:ribosomal protein S18 acetylase RimI-like enzyme
MAILGPYIYDPQLHSMEEFFSGNENVDAFASDTSYQYDKPPEVNEEEFVYVTDENSGFPLRVAAYLSFWNVGSKAGIGVIATDLEFQDQGLGVGLIRHALQTLDKNKVKTVELYCLGSRGFYQKLGFQPVRKEKNKLQISLRQLDETLNHRLTRPPSSWQAKSRASGHGLS